MRLSRQQRFEMIGAIVAVGVACAGFALGFFTFGRAGVVAILLSVPAGVLIWWLVIKLLDATHRILSELD